MRIFFLVCLLVTGWGCQTTPDAPSTMEHDSSAAIDPADIAELDAQRDAFLNAPDFEARLLRLLELEQQALALAEDEPLKLGSIGSAILDTYPGSQTGHYAMSQFYGYLESAEAKAAHDGELQRLQAYMSRNSDGSPEAPYPVITIYDAETYARTQDTSPVGAMYLMPRGDVFALLLLTRPQHGPLQRLHFDLNKVLQAYNHAAANEQAAAASDTPDTSDDERHAEEATHAQRSPSMIQLLAARMDSAAQAAIGRYLGQIRKFDEAISWLQVASRPGNVLANNMLARIYLTKAENTEDESQKAEYRELAMENYLHAIAMGSAESMYTLANLYINDYFGEDNRAAAIPLLRQAGELGHAESLLYLGYLYNVGREVEQNTDTAEEYFERAAALNNKQAILSYGRFLTGLQNDDAATPKHGTQAHGWLEQLAQAQDAEAMVILGNLHARGIGTPRSNRRAVRWYKKAVNTAPENAEIVNEVAWTLIVSDLAGLKRAKYAKHIMDRLMEEDKDAHDRPEYLDTWAAAHAATGDFSQAIALQKQAIQHATQQEREDVLEILRGHLAQFEAGAAITEKAP